MALMALLLAGCASTANLVGERKEYWERVVAAEIPVGTDKVAIESWATSKSVHLIVGAEDHLLRLLETVSFSDRICRGFGISLDVTLDAEGRATHEEIRSSGNCL